jgi:hypothetical protein
VDWFRFQKKGEGETMTPKSMDKNRVDHCVTTTPTPPTPRMEL